MIRTLIVDDEPLALDVLETYIEKIPDLKLVARCKNAMEANDILANEEVDLMFLDIQMPQLTGIDFVKTLSKPPLIVFTTAYANYALEGFELDALDYMLKPVSLDRFIKATNKAVEQLDLQRKSDDNNAVVLTDSITKDDFIFVKADKKLVKIKYSEIIYIEGLKDYVIIRTDTGRVITLQTMKSLEAKLPQHFFKRIHRSYIVAIDKIDAIVGNMVEVKDRGEAKHLPIGKNYRDELLEIVHRNKL